MILIREERVNDAPDFSYTLQIKAFSDETIYQFWHTFYDISISHPCSILMRIFYQVS